MESTLALYTVSFVTSLPLLFQLEKHVLVNVMAASLAGIGLMHLPPLTKEWN